MGVHGGPYESSSGTIGRKTMNFDFLLLFLDEWLKLNASGHQVHSFGFCNTQIDFKGIHVNLSESDCTFSGSSSMLPVIGVHSDLGAFQIRQVHTHTCLHLVSENCALLGSNRMLQGIENKDLSLSLDSQVMSYYHSDQMY